MHLCTWLLISGTAAFLVPLLVPKLLLGNAVAAKLSLATIFVPKCNLGTSKNTNTPLASGPNYERSMSPNFGNFFLHFLHSYANDDNSGGRVIWVKCECKVATHRATIFLAIPIGDGNVPFRNSADTVQARRGPLRKGETDLKFSKIMANAIIVGRRPAVQRIPPINRCTAGPLSPQHRFLPHPFHRWRCQILYESFSYLMPA